MNWPRYDINATENKRLCTECKNPASDLEDISITCGEAKYSTVLCHDCLEEEDVIYDLKEILEKMVKR